MTRNVVIVMTALLLPATLQAQSVLLRFDPPDGAVLHRLFQIHTRVLRAGGDSRESAELGGVREVTLRGRADTPMLHLAYDSLRTRLREGTGPWREIAESNDSAWVQVRFDEQLEPTVVASGGPGPAAARLVALVTGLPGLGLPRRPVRAGDRWTSRLEIPVPAMRPGAMIGQERLLVSEAVVSVDSVVARALDTLAYVSLRGTLGPAATGDRGYVGAVRGALVWSTGWQAFVSGATRTRIETRPENGQGAVLLETTVRQQVRPGS